MVVVCIGNFDGVHIGHQALLAEAKADADKLIVVTFWPHPLSVLAPARAPKLLSNLPERIRLLKAAGADEVRVVRFTSEVSNWSPERFIDTILRPLNPDQIVVGENFRFGYRAAGTLDDLRASGFEVRQLDLVESRGAAASSTRIRELIVNGDVAEAAELLGREYRVSGIVEVGDQRGRLLGFPTANLPVSNDAAVPADGVYAGWVTVPDEAAGPWPAAVSVGTNPTFAGLERRVESYVLDRTDLALYGVQIHVDFVQHLRGQIVFDGVDSLITQMRKDVARVREILDSRY